MLYLESQDELVATAAYAPEPAAVGAARRFVRDTLRSWELTGPAWCQLVDDAVLLTSELVTNAVLHAGTPVEVTCRLLADDQDGCVRRSVGAGHLPTGASGTTAAPGVPGGPSGARAGGDGGGSDGARGDGARGHGADGEGAAGDGAGGGGAGGDGIRGDGACGDGAGDSGYNLRGDVGSGGAVEIVVLDRRPAQLRPVLPNTSADGTERVSGRGLQLPSELASAWGVTYAREAKAVWFRMALQRTARPESEPQSEPLGAPRGASLDAPRGVPVHAGCRGPG